MLELRALSAGYGHTEVLREVSLHIEPGEVVALVGANGAGKSTLVKTVSGLLRPTGGAVLLDGTPIHLLPVAERVRRGIVHVPEGRQVFAGLTARENLRLGAYLDPADMDARIADACAPFPDVAARLDVVAGAFSGGQQQMLAIARGLMARPRLLLLDEPSLGLSPLLMADVFRLVAALAGPRHRRVAGRAERPCCARHRRPGRGDRERAGRDGGHGGRAAGQPGGCGALPGHWRRHRCVGRGKPAASRAAPDIGVRRRMRDAEAAGHAGLPGL